MSRLEQIAQPLLEDPVKRTPCGFGTPAQRVIAKWALKTALVFQASHTDEPIAPSGHYVHLRQREVPPLQVTVWLGSHHRAREDPANGVFVQRPLSFESLDGRIDLAQLQGSPFGYLNFLAVGGVSFLIVGHRFSNRVELEYEGHLADALIRIWPIRMPVVSWPPMYMMDQQLVDTITLPPSGFNASVWPPTGS